MLLDLLSEIVKINDVLLITKNMGVISEVRSNGLSVKQKEKWITIGENDGPAHIHINSETITCAEFVQEKKPDRTSFSVIFLDKNNERIFAAFFTKMYNESKMLVPERKKIYDDLCKKYDFKINF